MDEKMIARFWSHVDRRGPDDCWEWTAGTKGTYGSFARSHREKRPAHRESFELANGPVPEELQVLHTCDNRLCVNPKHLYAGTHQQNMADKRIRERGVFRWGEAHVQARLTDAECDDIRSRFDRGERPSAIHRTSYASFHYNHIRDVARRKKRVRTTFVGTRPDAAAASTVSEEVDQTGRKRERLGVGETTYWSERRK